MDVDRDQFLEEGYIVLRDVFSQDRLHDLRADYEIIVNHQKAICAEQRLPTDPPGGAWETSAQNCVNLGELSSRIDPATAPAVEIPANATAPVARPDPAL